MPSTAAFSIPALWIYFNDVDQLHFKMRVLYLFCTLKSGYCCSSKQSQVVYLTAQPMAVCLGNSVKSTLVMLLFSSKVPAVANILGLNIFAAVNLKHYQNCLNVVIG